jgi:hypothetical protein
VVRLAAPGGVRQRHYAVYLSPAEYVAVEAARALDGEDGRPEGRAEWLLARARERLAQHVAGDGERADVARCALAALALEGRLVGRAGRSKPPVVATDPRALVVGLRDLAGRQGDQEAVDLARQALREPVAGTQEGAAQTH